MDLEAQVVEAIRLELDRQAEQGELIVSHVAGRLEVRGPLELESLAMAVAGAVSGGP